MGKTVPNQPFILIGKASRMAFYLATVIGVGMSFYTPSQAEGGNDLVISKDGGNVNVNLNTASSSDVSIRRSDDIMVIKVPKSYKGGVSIDPALKKNSVIQETETPTGKAITIQSQQIYLHTWDGESVAGPQPTVQVKPLESKSSEKAASDEAGPSKAGFLTISPTDPNASPSPHHSTHGSRERTHHTEPVETPMNPLDLTRLLKQESLFSAPMVGEQRASSQPERHHSSCSSNQSRSESHTKRGKGKNSKQLKPEPIEPPKVEATPIPGDPESEPLEADSKRQAAAIQASINGLLRIFFSLGIVLALVVVFIKVLLPKLMDRYPEFFERLREGKQWTGERPTNLFANWPNAAQTPAQPTAPKPKPMAPSHQALVPRQEPTKKSYLERLQVAGDYFQVLQTTILGKGKELHLVELKGKQFLVATTPYTVTLLKDLSEEESPTQALENQFLQPKARQIEPERYAASPQAKRIPAESAQAKSETIAYLSDETPIRRVSSPKPNATRPGQGQTVQRKPLPPQYPAPPHEVYQTYTPKASTPQTQAYPAQPIPAATRAYAMPTAQPAYVDAEEVVVLEDYDDFYGH